MDFCNIGHTIDSTLGCSMAIKLFMVLPSGGRGNFFTGGVYSIRLLEINMELKNLRQEQ